MLKENLLRLLAVVLFLLAGVAASLSGVQTWIVITSMIALGLLWFVVSFILFVGEAFSGRRYHRQTWRDVMLMTPIEIVISVINVFV